MAPFGLYKMIEILHSIGGLRRAFLQLFDCEVELVAERKTKHRIAHTNDELFACAGLSEIWRSSTGHELKSCTIITTTPNQVLAPIHARMPVILLPEDEEPWLSPDLAEPEQVLLFLQPYPDGLLEAALA
jgi:putative SOS response-associated peptidase YedK